MMWEVLFCLFVEKEEERKNFIVSEDCRSGNRKGNTHWTYSALWLLFGGIQKGGGWELKIEPKEDPVCSLWNHRGRRGPGFLLMSRLLSVSEEMSVWSRLEVCHHQGLMGMPCAETWDHVNFLQMRRVSKTYFLLETVSRSCVVALGDAKASAGLNRKAWRVQKSRCRGDGDQ